MGRSGSTTGPADACGIPRIVRPYKFYINTTSLSGYTSHFQLSAPLARGFISLILKPLLANAQRTPTRGRTKAMDVLKALGGQYPITYPYNTARTMKPRTQASPISVLLGLGLLVGRVSLIETGLMGATGVGRIGIGSVMVISKVRKSFCSPVEVVMRSI